MHWSHTKLPVGSCNPRSTGSALLAGMRALNVHRNTILLYLFHTHTHIYIFTPDSLQRQREPSIVCYGPYRFVTLFCHSLLSSYITRRLLSLLTLCSVLGQSDDGMDNFIFRKLSYVWRQRSWIT